jgi:hypothetical protein
MSRRATVLAHFGIPLVLAVGAFVQALFQEGFSLEVVASQLLGTALFFAAPHLFWLASASALRLSGTSWHAGFFAASLSLVVVAVSPTFGLRDPSGLPYHWLLYWPLAVAAQFAVGGVALLRRRFHDV